MCGSAGRSERGQGTFEYVGMVAVAALIVGGLLTVGPGADVGRRIANEACQAISAVAPMECGATDDSAGGESGEGDGERPELEPPEERSPVCERSAEQPIGDQVIPGEVTVSTPGQEGPIESTVSGSVEVGPRTLDENGHEWQSVSFGLDSRVSVGADLGKARVGGSFEAYAGSRTGLKATVPPHLVEDVQNGDVPNPLNPLSMGEGVTVEMTQEFYSGHEASAHYNGLRGSYGFSEGTEVSTAVVRTDDDTVRVVTGPADVIRHAASLGIGTDDFNARLSSSQELKDYRLEQTEIDLSTDEGQAAYYDLVLFGQPPAAGDEGVVDTATIEGGSYNSKQDVGFKAGSFEASLLSSHSSLDDSTATRADGSSTRTLSWNDNNVGGSVTLEYDSAGNLVESGGQIRLRGVDPNFVDGFNQSWGGQPPNRDIEGETNMVLNLNQDEIEQIRGDALDVVVQRLKHSVSGPELAERAMGTSEPTVEDLVEWLPNASDDDIDTLLHMNEPELGFLLRSIRDGGDPDEATIRTIASLTAFADTPEELIEFLNVWGIDKALADGDEPGDYGGPGSMVCVGTA